MRLRRSMDPHDDPARVSADGKSRGGRSRSGKPRRGKKGELSAPNVTAIGDPATGDPAVGRAGVEPPATDTASEAAAPPTGRRNLVIAVVGGLGLTALAGAAYYWSVSPIPAIVVLVLTGVFVAAELVEARSAVAATKATGRPTTEPGGAAPGFPPPGVSFAAETPYPPAASYPAESRSASAVPPPGPEVEPRAVTSPLFRQGPDHRPPVIAEPPAPAVSQITGYGAYGARSRGDSGTPTGIAPGPAPAVPDVPDRAATRLHKGRPVSTVTGYGAYGRITSTPDEPDAVSVVDDTDPDVTIARGPGHPTIRREES